MNGNVDVGMADDGWRGNVQMLDAVVYLGDCEGFGHGRGGVGLGTDFVDEASAC